MHAKNRINCVHLYANASATMLQVKIGYVNIRALDLIKSNGSEINEPVKPAIAAAMTCVSLLTGTDAGSCITLACISSLAYH